MGTFPYDYDDFNAEQAMAEIDAYERDRAEKMNTSNPVQFGTAQFGTAQFGTAVHAWMEQS